jgi:hypothetical protein
MSSTVVVTVRLPETPRTETWYVPAGVPVFVLFPPPPPAEQEEIRTARQTRAPAATRPRTSRLVRLQRRAAAVRRAKAAMISRPDPNGPVPGGVAVRPAAALVRAVVFKVSCETAAAPPGVTDDGANVAVVPRGSPEHCRVMALSNDAYWGVTSRG